MSTPADRTERVAAFGAQLAELRIACGAPSYSRLRRWSAHLPPSTTSNVLSGKTAPRLDFVIWFVTGCLAAAGEAGLDVAPHLSDLNGWRQRWQTLQMDLREMRNPSAVDRTMPSAVNLAPVSPSLTPAELRAALDAASAELSGSAAEPAQRMARWLEVVHLHHLLGERDLAHHAYDLAASEIV